jgi:hypothetical protein
MIVEVKMQNETHSEARLESVHFKRSEAWQLGVMVNCCFLYSEHIPSCHQQQNKKLFTHLFPCPATWATLTTNGGNFSEISDWAQQTTEGMYGGRSLGRGLWRKSKNE